MNAGGKITGAELTALARALHDRGEDLGEDALLPSVTQSALEYVDGADFVGITLVDGSTLTSVAPTDPVAARLDELQHELREGPCLEAAWADQKVLVEDLDTETRWPRFVRRVRDETAVRSILAYQLFRGESAMGALNIYATGAHAFSAEAQEVALAVATHASLALHTARRGDQFSSALASRDVIGQAKGIVMERFDVDAVRAWDLIRKLSQDTNIRVADVARQLVEADHPIRHRDLLN
ncbi:GAF and ANTAR domain-containing protein [Williamsia deligens]|uniref:GAF and ANTAR domain-containing protein n=1 Tax=Williamsia deligens TaxID=321325 RepID=A0ABW3G480_9NOCA|nr:GAF and ANTAR domain-containing protein [Williamsia deligens]MCP2193807.1 GAF domain-containing protein [Williamsia deligens]